MNIANSSTITERYIPNTTTLPNKFIVEINCKDIKMKLDKFMGRGCPINDFVPMKMFKSSFITACKANIKIYKSKGVHDKTYSDAVIFSSNNKEYCEDCSIRKKIEEGKTNINPSEYGITFFTKQEENDLKAKYKRNFKQNGKIRQTDNNTHGDR